MNTSTRQIALSVSARASRRDWRVGSGASVAMFSGAVSGGTWLLRTDWTSEDVRE